MKLNDHVKARGDLQRIADEDLPLSRDLTVMAAEDLNNLAWHYASGPVKERDARKALPLIRKALALSPEDCNYFNTLGVVHYRLGQYPQAVQSLQRSLSDSGGQSAAFDLFFLAMCHARLGEAAKARDCYDQAVLWVRKNSNRLGAIWRRELKDFQGEAERELAARALE
jgi:tetratricopeptide (TPR) repeat protein